MKDNRERNEIQRKKLSKTEKEMKNNREINESARRMK